MNPTTNAFKEIVTNGCICPGSQTDTVMQFSWCSDTAATIHLAYIIKVREESTNKKAYHSVYKKHSAYFQTLKTRTERERECVFSACVRACMYHRCFVRARNLVIRCDEGPTEYEMPGANSYLRMLPQWEAIYSASTKVSPLSCARLSIGNVPGCQCWKCKP
jgi:hypothetical protein